jgi:hypothetical protein
MSKWIALVMTVAIIPTSGSGGGPVISPGWEKRLQQRLGEFQSCKEKIDDSSPCNRFVAQALSDVYGIHDFEDPAKKGQYLSANLIEAYVLFSKDWVLLGMADSQKALDEASSSANKGYAVIAVRPGEDHGHVAIVLPGPLSNSPSWKLNVPNSASFFLGKATQSYVGDKLSKAFATPTGVKLFARSS